MNNHNIEELLGSYSFTAVGLGFAVLLGLTALSLLLKHQTNGVKKFLFISIIVAAILPTLFLTLSTVYVNAISVSKGPVHWHADVEIWACGNEVNLRDPKGWSNKIGTATLHEHNDKRIHLEGVLINHGDASLGKFFNVIGGSISEDTLVVPVNEGTMLMQSGITCGDGTYREFQTFVYKTDEEGYYTQMKLADPGSYSISPESSVPQGDCVILELDTPKEKTERMCTSYEVAKKIGKLKGER